MELYGLIQVRLNILMLESVLEIIGKVVEEGGSIGMAGRLDERSPKQRTQLSFSCVFPRSRSLRVPDNHMIEVRTCIIFVR